MIIIITTKKLCKARKRVKIKKPEIFKGEWQSLVLYVKEPVKWPPVDEMSWDFACREQMGLRLQGKKLEVNST